MSDCVRPHRQQATRLLCPWDSPGKNTGVGCHFLLQCTKVKSESEVAQSCPTLSYLRQTWISAYSSHTELPVKPDVWIEGKASSYKKEVYESLNLLLAQIT